MILTIYPPQDESETPNVVQTENKAKPEDKLNGNLTLCDVTCVISFLIFVYLTKLDNLQTHWFGFC